MNKNHSHIFCYMTIAAVIAGCANTNNAATSAPTVNQDLLVGFSVHFPDASAGNLEHTIKMDGYSIFVNDEERRTDVSLHDQFAMTVPANATIHKDSIKDLNADVVDAFFLTGYLRIENGLKNVMIPMANHDFGFITVEPSEHLHI